MKGQLQELGEEVDDSVANISKMQGQILNMTGGHVNIFDESGEFKSTYDIMKGIAEIWDDLDSISQADLLETIAGKHRANDVAALISNWENVEKAMVSALDAEGSAAEENAKYIDSMQGGLDRLTTAWQSFANSFMESDLLKTGTKALTILLETLEKITDTIGTMGTLSIGTTIIGLFKGGLVSKLAGAVDGFTGLATALKGLGKAIGVVGGIGLAISTITILYGVLDNYHKGLAEERQKIISEADTFLSAYDSFEEVYIKYSGKTKLTSEEEAELEQAIKGTTDALKDKENTLHGVVNGAQDYVTSLEAIARAEAKVAEEQASDKATNAEKELQATVKGWYSFDGSEVDINFDSSMKQTEVMKLAEKSASKYYKRNAGSGLRTGMYSYSLKLDPDASMEEVLDYYYALNDFKQELEDAKLIDTADYDRVVEVLGKMSEAIDLYTNGVYDAAKAQYQLMYGIPKTTEDYLAMRESVLNSEKIKGTSLETKLQIANSLDTEYADLFDLSAAEVQARSFIGVIDKFTDEHANKFETFLELRTSVNDGEETSVEEYLAELNKVEQLASEFSKEEWQEIKIKFGFGIDDDTGLELDAVKQQYDNIVKRIMRVNGDDETAAQELLGDLDIDELSAVVKMDAELEIDWETIDSSDELKKIAEKEAEVIKAMRFTIDIEGETKGIESFNTALSESRSAAGLTAESLEAMKNRYKGLESYNAAKLFTETANGISFNAEELNKLEKEYNETNLEQTNDSLKVLKNRYDELGVEIQNTGNAAKHAELFRERENIRAQIVELAELASMYEGLTSSYNEWQNAESAGNDRDMYANIHSAMEGIGEELGDGWIDDGTREYFQLIWGEDNWDGAGKTLADYRNKWATLDNTIKGTSYSIEDFFKTDKDGNLTSKGLTNFYKAVGEVQKSLGEEWIKYNDDGSIKSIDFSVDGTKAIADALGISEELVQIFARASEDAGFVVNFDGTYTQLADLQKEAVTAVDKLKELGLISDDVKFDFNTKSIESLNEQLNQAHTILDNKDFWNADGSFNFDAKGAKEAMQIVSTLQAQLDQLQHSHYQGITTDEKAFKEPLEKLDEYEDKIAQINQLKLNPEVNKEEIELLEGDLVEIAKYLEGLDKETKKGLGIEGLSYEEIQKEIEAGTVKIPGELELNMKMSESLDDMVNIMLLNSGLLTLEEEAQVLIDLGIDVGEIDDEKVKKAVQNIIESNSGEEKTVEVDIETTGDEDIDALGEHLATLDDEEIEVIANVFGKMNVEELQTIVNGLEDKEVEAIAKALGEGDVNGLKEAINNLDPKTVEAIAKALGYNDVNDLYNAIGKLDGKTVQAIAKAFGITDVDSLRSAIDNLDGKTVEAIAKAIGAGDVQSLINTIANLKDKTVTVKTIAKRIVENVSSDGSKEAKQRTGEDYSPADGTAHVNGSAFVNGTNGKAFKNGDWGIKGSGTALAGELGQELVVRDGKYFTVGDNGAEFFEYKPNDIVFNAGQTEQLFEQGKLTNGKTRGRALAGGTSDSNKFAYLESILGTEQLALLISDGIDINDIYDYLPEIIAELPQEIIDQLPISSSYIIGSHSPINIGRTTANNPFISEPVETLQSNGFDITKYTLELDVQVTGDTEWLENYGDMVAESRSGTGLTIESKTSFDDRYSGLEGYDSSKLFIETSHGTALNEDYAKELEEQRRTANVNKASAEFMELQDQHQYYTRLIRETKNEALKAQYQTYLDDVNEKMDIYSQFILGYDKAMQGATSSYAEWLDAKELPSNMDMYETISNGIESITDKVTGGIIDDEVIEFYQLMLGEEGWDAANKSLSDYQAELSIIKDMTDGWFKGSGDGNPTAEGIMNFVGDVGQVQDALGKEFVQYNEDGNIVSFDIEMDDAAIIAEALGVSEELVQIFIRASQDVADNFGPFGYGESTDFKAKYAEDAALLTQTNALIEESNSAAGLSIATVEATHNAYKDLESYNAGKLFEDIGDGIRINEEELARLNKELVNTNLQNAITELATAQQRYDELTVAIQNCTNADEKARLANQQQALAEQIAMNNLAIAAYEGLAASLNVADTAYAKWQNTLASGNNRDMLTTIVSGVEESVAEINSGIIDASTIDLFNLMFGEGVWDSTGKTLQDGLDMFDSVVKGTEYRWSDILKLDDDGNISAESLLNIVDAVEQVEDVIGKDLVQHDAEGNIISFDIALEDSAALAEAWGITQEFAKYLIMAIQEVGIGLHELNNTPLDLASKFNESASYVNEFNSLLEEANSTAGLSYESIENITALGENLEGYDFSKLFVFDDGVRLNAEEFERFVGLLLDADLEQLNEELATAQQNYDKLTVAIQDCTDADTLAGLVADQQDAQRRIDECNAAIEANKGLAASYGELTSSYTEYQNALASGNDRDEYTSIADGLQSAQAELDNGWISDSTVQLFQYILGEEGWDAAGKSLGDYRAQMEAFNETIAGTTYSLMDFYQYNEDGELTARGMYNALDALGQLQDSLGKDWIQYDENGNIVSFDVDVDDAGLVAQALGVGSEWAKAFILGAQDIGAGLLSLVDFIDVESLYDTDVTWLSTLTNALNESKSATGLTMESIDALKERYGDLEDFDTDKLFKKTANGVTVNTKEVKKLEKAYASSELKRVGNNLKSLKSEYSRLTFEIQNCTDAERKSDLTRQRDAIESQIKELEEYSVALKGLTSAYNKWQNAESSETNRSMYVTAYGSAEDIGHELELGWIDEGTEKYFQLIWGEDKWDGAGKSVDDYRNKWDTLDDTIAGTTYSVASFFKTNEDGELTSEGIFNFYQAVAQKQKELGEEWVTLDENGNVVSFDFGVDGSAAVADALGISQELVQIFLRASQDCGFVVNFDGTYMQLEELEARGTSAIEVLRELGYLGNFTFNAETNDVNSLEDQLADANSILNQFRKDDTTIDFTMPGATEALQLVTALQAKTDSLKYNNYTGLTTRDEDFAEPLAKAQEYEQLIKDIHMMELNPEIYPGEIEPYRQKLAEIVTYFSNLSEEQKIELGIEGDTPEDIQRKLESGEITIPATLSIEGEMNQSLQDLVDLALLGTGLLSEERETEIMVRFGIVPAGEPDTSEVDGAIDDALNGDSSSDGTSGKTIDTTIKITIDGEVQEFTNLETALSSIYEIDNPSKTVTLTVNGETQVVTAAEAATTLEGYKDPEPTITFVLDGKEYVILAQDAAALINGTYTDPNATFSFTVDGEEFIVTAQQGADLLKEAYTDPDAEFSFTLNGQSYVMRAEDAVALINDTYTDPDAEFSFTLNGQKYVMRAEDAVALINGTYTDPNAEFSFTLNGQKYVMQAEQAATLVSGEYSDPDAEFSFTLNGQNYVMRTEDAVALLNDTYTDPDAEFSFTLNGQKYVMRAEDAATLINGEYTDPDAEFSFTLNGQRWVLRAEDAVALINGTYTDPEAEFSFIFNGQKGMMQAEQLAALFGGEYTDPKTEFSFTLNGQEYIVPAQDAINFFSGYSDNPITVTATASVDSEVATDMVTFAAAANTLSSKTVTVTATANIDTDGTANMVAFANAENSLSNKTVEVDATANVTVGQWANEANMPIPATAIVDNSSVDISSLQIEPIEVKARLVWEDGDTESGTQSDTVSESEQYVGEQAQQPTSEIAWPNVGVDSDTLSSMLGNVERFKEVVSQLNDDELLAFAEFAGFEGASGIVESLGENEVAINEFISGIRTYYEELDADKLANLLRVNIPPETLASMESFTGFIDSLENETVKKVFIEIVYSTDDSGVEEQPAVSNETSVTLNPVDGALNEAASETREGNVLLTPDISPITQRLQTPFTGKVNLSVGTVTGTVTIPATVTVSSGTTEADGTAYVSGTIGKAFAYGSWGTKDSGTALVGELGQEMVVRDGRFFTIGDNGAEFFKYKKNDIIFNAGQTKQLLEQGKLTGGRTRGRAVANGTAFVSGTAFENGTGNNTPNYSWNNTSFPSSSKSGSGSGSSGDDADEFLETIDWIEITIERVERAISRLDLKASSTFKKWSTRNNALVDEVSKVSEEIDLQSRAYDRYMQEANSIGLSSDYAEKVLNGTIDIEDITDESLKEQIDEFQEWAEKALDASDAVEELKEQLAELYQQRFDNVASEYDGILGVIEHEKNMLEEYMNQSEAQAWLTSALYYDALAKNERETMAELEKQKAEQLEALNDAVASGTIAEYSESWYEMVNAIDETTLSIAESNTTLLEYQQSIQELEWEQFDVLQAKISQITNETEFLIDLMSSDELYDDRGQLTDSGMSTMGLHGVNYNTHMYQADQAGAEAARLKNQLEDDPFDQDLLDRYNEMLELQREHISNAEDEKEAIRDMVSEGIELELDALDELIQKRKDALDAEHDMYSYSKEVAEQTAEIASLQKQLSSFEGDDSEETMAKVQELKVSLAEAEESLQETEYERWIQDTEILLDELYLEYEEILNTRLDNLDLLISDMILEINNSALGISTTLSAKAEQVGYTLSDELEAIWDVDSKATNDAITNGSSGIKDTINNTANGVKNVITTYGTKFSEAQTTTNNTLKNISTDVANMIKQLNTIAKTNIKSSAESTAAKSSEASGSKTSTSTSTNKNNTSTSKGDGKPKVGDKVKFVSGQYYYDSQGKKPLGNHNLGKEVYITSVNNKSWATHPYHISTGSKLGKGDLGWLKLSQISGYATGRRNFPSNEVAWTQENGEEYIIRPSDGAILTPLAKSDSVLTAAASGNLWNVANNPADFIRENLGIGDISAPVGFGGQTNVKQNFEQIVFSLPNVRNYEQLLSEMQRDKNFERLILSMTFDQVAGKSSLAKGKALR